MWNILLFILMFFLLEGCSELSDLLPPKDVTHSLPQGGRTTLKYGQVLEYKSNNNNVAKFSVMKVISGYFWVSISKRDGEQSKPWEMWDYEAVLLDSVGKIMTESQNKILNRSSNIAYPTWIYYDNSNYPDFIWIKNYATGSTFPESGAVSANWYNKVKLNSGKSTSFKIMNRNFSNVVYYDLVTGSPNAAGRDVITFYCNSQTGLIGFKYSDGEVFELVE